MTAAHLHDTPPPTWHAQRDQARVEDAGRIEQPGQHEMPWPVVAMGEDGHA